MLLARLDTTLSLMTVQRPTEVLVSHVLQATHVPLLQPQLPVLEQNGPSKDLTTVLTAQPDLLVLPTLGPLSVEKAGIQRALMSIVTSALPARAVMVQTKLQLIATVENTHLKEISSALNVQKDITALRKLTIHLNAQPGTTLLEAQLLALTAVLESIVHLGPLLRSTVLLASFLRPVLQHAHLAQLASFVPIQRPCQLPAHQESFHTELRELLVSHVPRVTTAHRPIQLPSSVV